MIDETELVAMLRAELGMAQGFGDESEQSRARAMQYYFGEAGGAEAGVGRSNVVSTDVADMVEATVAQMIPALLAEPICEPIPAGANDVDRARSEGRVVNHVIMQLNQGDIEFQSALRDALLQRNGWMKVWREECDYTETRVFHGVRREAVAEAVASGQLGAPATIEVEYEKSDADDAEAGTVDATVRRTYSRNRVKCRAADPALMCWTADYPSLDLQKIPFLAEVWLVTESELIERGYSRAIVQELPDFSAGEAALARYARAPNQAAAGNSAARVVECHRCWYLYDSDGDGISERHEIVLGGEAHVLGDEIVDMVPFACGTAILRSHSLEGLSLFDRIKQVQDVKTTGLRQWLDNAENANNNRYAVNERVVNPEDTNKATGPLRIRGEVTGNFMPFSGVDVGPSMLSLLGYMDQARSERGGASLDMQSAAAQVGANASGVAVDREYTVKEQMAGLFCMTLAVTLIRNTYALVHQALRRWSDGKLSVPIGGRFVDADPASWVEREAWNVKRGLSFGERDRRKGALAGIVVQQEKLVSAGYEGVLVTADQYYTALVELAYASALDSPERYFTDPSTPESQAAGQRRSAGQAAAKKAELEALTGPIRAQNQVELVKTAQKATNDRGELGYKYWSEMLSAELELIKQGGVDAMALRELQAQGESAVLKLEQSRGVENGGDEQPATAGVG